MQSHFARRIARFWNPSHKWLAMATCAMLSLPPGVRVNAADRHAWRHPDSRFAAVDDAVDNDDFPQAQKLLAEIRAEAKRARDPALQAEALEHGKEVTKLARDFEKIAKHVKSLEKNRRDHKASLAVGKYYCVVKGQWKTGLPLLAAGDDPKLAAIAAEDSDDILLPDDQLALGEHWWQYAEKVPDATERIACQLRAREWMIRAQPRASEKQRILIEQRLKQIPLFPEKVVVWNTHNGDANDRGAEEILVSLLFQGQVVWKQTTEIAWRPNESPYVLLRPKRVRADQVRVDITRQHFRGGGLSEIEVVMGKTNLVRPCQPEVESYFAFNEGYGPLKLVDGKMSGNVGDSWVADKDVPGWATIHFAELPPVK